ncbi:lytic transglycosylase domain-containing protein, partial [Escherichia coli]|uniref:lytic transglycosylase domain-containing protein n=1 Tax=Escherichia coli TaxID=562 RepID=UPI0030798FE5
AYLRAMYDRFGYPGLFAAYNAGPARYADHLATGKPLAGETRDYIAQLARSPASPAMPPAILSGTRLFFTLGSAEKPALDTPESAPEKPMRNDLF